MSEKENDDLIAKEIRYPEDWDTAVYPTLLSALWERYCWEKGEVPVVSVEWIENYVKRIRDGFKKNQPSDFGKGEETGRIEGLEVMLAEARKQAGKKGV